MNSNPNMVTCITFHRLAGHYAGRDAFDVLCSLPVITKHVCFAFTFTGNSAFVD